MAISKFKATCLAVLEQVRQTGEPVRVTRFGKPVAEIVPPSPGKAAPGWLGSLEGTLEIRGDIVEAPAIEPDAWEAIACAAAARHTHLAVEPDGDQEAARPSPRRPRRRRA